MTSPIVSRSASPPTDTSDDEWIPFKWGRPLETGFYECCLISGEEQTGYWDGNDWLNPAGETVLIRSWRHILEDESPIDVSDIET